MSTARHIGAATLALMVLAGACQRRSEGPTNTRTGAVRSDTALRDSGFGAGTDSSAPGTSPGAGDPRRDSAVADTGTDTGTDTALAPQDTARRSSRDGARTSRPSAPRSSRAGRDSAKAVMQSVDSAVTPAETSSAAVAPADSPTTTAAAGGPPQDPYHQPPRDTVDARTYQGWKYFNLNCARCHGEDVQGTTIAPHLIVSLRDNGTIPNEEAFQTVVCGGRVEKGMPAWCSLGMTPPQIDTIYAYVKGRADAKLHPGRPARRE